MSPVLEIGKLGCLAKLDQRLSALVAIWAARDWLFANITNGMNLAKLGTKQTKYRMPCLRMTVFKALP